MAGPVASSFCLTVRLPRADVARASETILPVEDDDQVSARAQNILPPCGYAILETPNGDEAFLICEKQHSKIDLLLTPGSAPQSRTYDFTG